MALPTYGALSDEQLKSAKLADLRKRKYKSEEEGT
jgi:hypothetical protein